MDFGTKVQGKRKIMANYGKRQNSRHMPKFTVSVNSMNSWFSS